MIKPGSMEYGQLIRMINKHESADIIQALVDLFRWKARRSRKHGDIVSATAFEKSAEALDDIPT